MARKAARTRAACGVTTHEPGGDLSGYWSRRIDDEHRLAYRADDEEVKILKARCHHSD